VALTGGGDPQCKRCEYELKGGEDTCPRCQFSPREKGLRVAMVFFMGMVALMTITTVVPQYGLWLVRLAIVLFILAFVTLLFSFLATPSRFGSLFLRL